MQMFKPLMIDFNYQFASRTRNKRKLSVLSIVKAFDKFPCGILSARGRASSEVPSQPSGEGTALGYVLVNKFIVSYEFSFLFDKFDENPVAWSSPGVTRTWYLHTHLSHITALHFPSSRPIQHHLQLKSSQLRTQK